MEHRAWSACGDTELGVLKEVQLEFLPRVEELRCVHRVGRSRGKREGAASGAGAQGGASAATEEGGCTFTFASAMGECTHFRQPTHHTMCTDQGTVGVYTDSRGRIWEVQGLYTAQATRAVASAPRRRWGSTTPGSRGGTRTCVAS